MSRRKSDRHTTSFFIEAPRETIIAGTWFIKKRSETAQRIGADSMKARVQRGANSAAVKLRAKGRKVSLPTFSWDGRS